MYDSLFIGTKSIVLTLPTVLSSADCFFFKINYFGEYHDQTVCKGYQQTTLVG